MARTIPPALQAHLVSGATSLCWCWKLTRRDGVVSGFTDHDRDIEFDEVVFSAASGLDGSAFEQNLGLAAGGGEVRGVLASQSILEQDAAEGIYDGAVIEIWRVNWSDVSQRVVCDVAVIGEITRSGKNFTAELRSLAHGLDQERGKVYRSQCDANLGDAQCGVNLLQTAYQAAVSIQAVNEGNLFSIALNGFQDGWFSLGVMSVTSGANAGRAYQLATHRQDGAIAHVALEQKPAAPFAPGDSVILRAGCDKAFATCRNKFSNTINFRGFPHIPGNDALISHAGNIKQTMDGGSMFR